MNFYGAKNGAQAHGRHQPQDKQARILSSVRDSASKRAQDFALLLSKLERLIESDRSLRKGGVMGPAILSKPENELAMSCRTDLTLLSELYEVASGAITEKVKRLRRSGELTQESCLDLMREREDLREWFVSQDSKLASEYETALSNYGRYRISTRYASYKIRKVMMWDVDDSLTPTNVPSMFDGLLGAIQDKCDEGYELSLASGKDREYIGRLLSDPYGTGVLIDNVREAIRNGGREEDIGAIAQLISESRAGLLSDLGLLEAHRDDLQALLSALEQRKRGEWLPGNLLIISESGCIVQFPDGTRYLTSVKERTEFIPMGEAGHDARASIMEELGRMRAHLESLFNDPGILLIEANSSPKVDELIGASELSRRLPPALANRAVSSITENTYIDTLAKGGRLYGEDVEPRESVETSEASCNRGAVIIIDRTFGLARGLLEGKDEGTMRTGLSTLKELVAERRIGVTSDIALIEECESAQNHSELSRKVEGLLRRFSEREVIVIPKPAISLYAPNEVMYCPRPATYSDGDRITQAEEFMVRALYRAAATIIRERGLTLECSSANHGLDITPLGVSKRVAPEALDHAIPGPLKIIIYFGDSPNDVAVMSLKDDAEFTGRTNSMVIPVAVLLKEGHSNGARRVPQEVIRISDAQVRNLADITLYESIVERKISELRASHEVVQKS